MCNAWGGTERVLLPRSASLPPTRTKPLRWVARLPARRSAAQGLGCSLTREAEYEKAQPAISLQAAGTEFTATPSVSGERTGT